jgi:hypothetical protein
MNSKTPKTITLQEAFTILEDCSALIIDDNVLVYPRLEDLTGDLKNEFLYLSWEEDGEDFEVRFLEGQNQNVQVSGSSLFLIDSEGEDNQLTVLTPKSLV